MADEKVLDRVRKLLDRAAHPKTPPAEAELANERAQALMSRHMIDQALLEKDTIGVGDVDYVTIPVEAPYAYEKANLLHVISEHNSGKAVAGARSVRFAPTKKDPLRYLINYSKGVDVKVYGFASDLDNIEFLFTHLLVQLVGMVGRMQSPPGMDKGTYRAAVMAGFTEGVNRRMHAMNRRAKGETSGSGAELVLADRKALVKRFVDEIEDLEETEARRYDGAAFHQGREAGEQADLNQTRVRQNRSRALSS